MQKLSLPINDSRVTASYNTSAYRQRFDFDHCGTDFIGAGKNREIIASGEGQVMTTGHDNVCGNIVVVLYPGAYFSDTDSYRDVVFRYFHLDSISVKAGDKLKTGDLLGVYGDTGSYTVGKHLHLEVDLDTKFSLYTPSILSGSLLKGTNQGAYPLTHKANTTKNPLRFLHVRTEYPYCQTYSTTGDEFIAENDFNLPGYQREDLYSVEKENQSLKEKLKKIRDLCG